MKKRFLSSTTHLRVVGPGLAILCLILIARLLGLFQGLELKTLDILLRLRPAEPTDERVLIVGINENDIQQVGTYPIPDETLAELLQKLEQYQPRVVGIDIYRDLPVPPGHETFVETLAQLPYAIGIEKVLNESVPPPPSLSEERIGFVDLPLDSDGFVRRVTLGTYATGGVYHFALSVRLAEMYLAAEGQPLENGLRDPAAMRFGDTELTRLHPSTGGYVRTGSVGNQMLLNVRSGDSPFRIVSLNQVMIGDVEPDWIRDAIVLIGITSLSTKDLVNSAAVASDNPGLVYGVEIQAHATSQIVSAVLDDRPLLKSWPDGFEYVWIALWGLLGIGMALSTRRLAIAVLGGMVLLTLVLVSGVGLIRLAIWVPTLVPAIAFVMTNAATTSLRLSQLQQQQQMTMRLLGQQTSPEIAQALWNERDQLVQAGKLPPRWLTATILFSDIRSFTTLSEQQSPLQVMDWLNDYFITMTEEVQRHQGIVVKFIGDGLMAAFGVPVPRTTPEEIAADAKRAVNCAIAMGQQLEDLNQQRKSQGLEPIQIRVGIFTGPVVVGSLGGQQRLEYGVIGDSVNTASRLESYQKDNQPTNCRILIAQETRVHLGGERVAEAWGEILLRGRRHTVQVYRVLG